MACTPPESPKRDEEAFLDMLNLSRDEESDVMGDSESSYFQAGLSPTENDDRSPNPYNTEIPLDSARTPPRIMSSNTLLYGENLVTSTRLSGNSYLAPRLSYESQLSSDGEKDDQRQEEDPDLLFSPSLQSGQTSEATTPPSTTWAPSLSPPPLHTANSTSNHQPAEAHSFSSKTSKKRPPRAPIVNLRVSDRNRNNWNTRHIRGGSTGEGSLLSALTESSGEPFALRERSNSQTMEGHEGIDIDVPSSLQQPILSEDPGPVFDDDDDDKPMFVEKSPTSPPSSPAVQQREYEAEARESIRKAMEEGKGVKSLLFPRFPVWDMPPDSLPLSSETNKASLSSLMSEFYSVQERIAEQMKQPLLSCSISMNGKQQKESACSGPQNAGEVLATNLITITEATQVRLPNTGHDEESIPLTTSTNSDEKRPGTLEAAERGKVIYPKPLDERSMQLPYRFKSLEWLLRRPKHPLLHQMRQIIVWIVVPSLLVSGFLFYFGSNPMIGSPVDGSASMTASISWWILFLGVRHPLMLLLAQVSEFVLVDRLALRSRPVIRLLGPNIALLVSSGKGWPGVLSIYGCFCLVFLYGKASVAHHWLYLQNQFGFLTMDNPSGDFLQSSLYLRFLVSCIAIGFSVSIKRCLLGHYLARRLVGRYHDRMAALIEKMTLLSEVASFSIDFSSAVPSSKHALFSDPGTSAYGSIPLSPMSPDNRKLERRENVSRQGLAELLDEWNEPIREKVEMMPIETKDVLDFNQSRGMILTDCPFSPAFGTANTRKACAESASELFDRLVFKQDGSQDSFCLDSLNGISWNAHLNSERKRKQLATLLHTNEAGRISRSDFLKSVDEVYREIRVFTAGIRNSTAVDLSCEQVLNAIFYALFGFVLLSVFGVAVLPLMASVVGILIASALLLGPASSSYLHGIGLVLIRRPYDIGDCIAISRVDDEPGTLFNGNGWVVENFDLLNTTVRSILTGELATIANGCLATARITNMQRSDCVYVRLKLKFGIDVPLKTVQVFRAALSSFVRVREHQWERIVSLRSLNVEPDLGFTEYLLILRARGSWQKTQYLQESKTALCCYCSELQRQLDMLHIAPPLPIDISNASLGHIADNRCDGKKSKGSAATLSVLDDPMISTDSVNSLDDGVASFHRLLEAKKGKQQPESLLFRT